MLKVGAGKSVLNPEEEMFPIPKAKGTRYTGIYDDISCRALAIENERKKFLFVCYELGRPPHIPDLADKLSKETDIPADNIIIAATHNHTAPDDWMWNSGSGDSPEEIAFYEKYWVIEEKAGITAAKQAVNSMRPAKYGYGETLSYINTNRDLQTPYGYWVEARNLAAFSDKTLAVLKFVDEENRLIAAVLNYGAHAVCAFMEKDFDGKRKTSGNFPGVTCRYLEEHYGNDAIVLWTSAAAGNQNPLISHGMQYEYSDGYTTAVPYPDGVGYMHLELMGRTHAADAWKCIDGICCENTDVEIRHVRKSVMLPAQKREKGPHMFRMGGKGLRNFDVVPVGKPIPIPETPVMVQDKEHPVELKMQLLLLGDVAIVCAGAELYAEIGAAMKEASPMKKTFIVTHTEMEGAGYILDKNSKDHKVFQAYCTRVTPGEADELILATQDKMFHEILVS